MKKILVKYRGMLVPLNQKSKIAVTNRGRPIFYNSKEYADSKREIQLKVRTHILAQTQKNGGMFSKTDGAILADMVIYWPNRADVDAFGKLILDALEGLAYENDKLIKKLIMEIKEKQSECGFDLILSQINPAENLFSLPENI